MNPIFFCGIFHWKCRDNVELPLKNDDFLLKFGRLFCNSRYMVARVITQGMMVRATGTQLERA